MQRADHEIAPAPTLEGPAPFHVIATASLQERRLRTMKHGNSFAVFDHNGDALGGPEGIFHQDTRYLSYLYLTLGRAPATAAELDHA
jgi:hypothetical protein